MIYHTALSGGSVISAESVARYELNGSVAMQHDLFDPLPKEFDACDVFYCEPPFPDGFTIFNDRAGVTDGRTYEDFARRVGQIIGTIKVPMFLLAAKRTLAYWPKPRFLYKLRHPAGGLLRCAVYNPDADSRTPEIIVHEWSESLIFRLAERFGCVGDFACGYGQTARIFHEKGKRFIVSDYVGSCIGVIRDEFEAP